MVIVIVLTSKHPTIKIIELHHNETVLEAAILILVVENDPDLARRLAEGLARIGFTVENAADGQTAYELGRSVDFDAVILDLGLPDMSGAEVVRRWRGARREMPILILTAHANWTDKVEGLNAGADDYLTKPSHVHEIAARLSTLIRRSVGRLSPPPAHSDTESWRSVSPRISN